MNRPPHILISRTDGIGDVVLTLPMAGLLKRQMPDCRISFMGTRYTRPILDACVHIDNCINWDEIGLFPLRRQARVLADIGADYIIHAFPSPRIARASKVAGIPCRIGTSHRWYHWLRCNRLIGLSRKNSRFHESQLNLRLLAPFGCDSSLSIDDVAGLFGLERIPALRPDLKDLLSTTRRNLILHPRSKGSAREWGPDRFSELVDILPADRYAIHVTGSPEEGASMRDFFARHASRVTDLTGKLSLTDLVAFVNNTDAIVAGSTGPLHLAGAMGKVAIGLYAPRPPIWPRRWGPVGRGARALAEGDPGCRKCVRGGECSCIRSIGPLSVAAALDALSFPGRSAGPGMP